MAKKVKASRKKTKKSLAKKVKKAAPKPVIKLDIEVIIEMIIDGKTFREISESESVSLGKLHSFTSSTEHSARVRDALKISADSYSDMAEQVLKEAAGNLIEISRARELAQHYRWKASKRDPRRFSDKLELSGDPENPVTQSVVIFKLPDNGRGKTD